MAVISRDLFLHRGGVATDSLGMAGELLHCMLQAPGWHGVIHAICVHLGLIEAHRRRRIQFLCGLVNGLPMLRLDRIYVRNARAHRPLPLPRLPWARLSDHAPLAAEISL